MFRPISKLYNELECTKLLIFFCSRQKKFGRSRNSCKMKGKQNANPQFIINSESSDL